MFVYFNHSIQFSFIQFGEVHIVILLFESQNMLFLLKIIGIDYFIFSIFMDAKMVSLAAFSLESNVSGFDSQERQ